MSKLSRLGRIIGATKKFTGSVTGSTARAEAALQAEKQAQKQAKLAAKAKKLKAKNKRLKRKARDQEELQEQKTKKPKKRKDKKLKEVVDEQADQRNVQFEKRAKGKAVKTKNLDEFAESSEWAGNGLAPRGKNVWDSPKKLKKFLKQNPQHQGKSEFAQRQEYFKAEMRRIFNQPGRPWHKHPDIKRIRAFGRIGQRYQSRMIPLTQKKNYLP